MMVKLVNKNGGITYVDELRLDEYLGAGHRLASNISVSNLNSEAEEKKPKRVKKNKE